MVTCYLLFYFSKRLKCSFQQTPQMFISCQLLPLLQMFISLQLLPSFQYFTLIRLRNNIKKCVGQVRVTLPKYDCNRSRRRHINSPTTKSPTLLFTNQDVGEVTGMSASWPSTTIGKLTKGIGELTCHRSDRVPEVLTCVAIQISNVSLVLLPDPRKEFCSLDTPHRLFLLQTFLLSTKGWTNYDIKFRKINKKDEKSWAW